jgi:YegS/Rv2252/BmrU family lipid kinase
VRALLVVNPAAGRGLADTVRGELQQRLGPDLDVHVTVPDTDPVSSIVPSIERAADAGARLVVACGGDGTVAAVADAMIRAAVSPDTVMAIVAGGTANVMARELGIPLDHGEAVELALGPHASRPVDAMEVDGRHFINQIGIGLDAMMIADTPVEAKQRLGRGAYILTLLSKLGEHRAHRFQVDVDGRRFRVRAGEVLLANVGAFGLPPFTWGPDIDVSDGVVNLCMFNVESTRGYLRLLVKAVTSRHRQDSISRYEEVRGSATISSWVPVSVQADGEIIGTTPVTVRVVPGAIRIAVPEEAAGMASEVTGALKAAGIRAGTASVAEDDPA